MKNLFILTLLLSFALFHSCGDNPRIETGAQNSINPVTPGDDGPHDPDLPDDSDDTTSPNPTIKLYRVEGRALVGGESVVLPYLEKHFEIVGSSPVYENKPVKNAQTVFAFDLPIIDFSTEAIVDVVIRSDLFTHKKNKGTEIICSLDLKICSGLAIKENSKILQLFRKNRNPLFWSASETTQMSNYQFINVLNYAQEHDKKTFRLLDADLELSKILETSYEEMIGLLSHSSIYFTIADDTMVVRPVLFIKVRQ